MGVDLEALKAKYEKLTADPKDGSNSDFLQKFMQLEMGNNVVRILPWSDDSKEFYAETSIHRVPDSKHDLKGQARNIHCLKTIGKKCPVCDFYYGLWKTGLDSDKTIARQIKPRERYYMNIYDRTSKSVKILSVGKKLFSSIVGSIMDPDYGDITDLKTGHDFKIFKEVVTGSDNQSFPNYDKSLPRPKASPLGTDAEIAEIMDQLHDIHGLVKHQEYSEIKERIDEFYNGPKVMRVGVTTTGETETSSEETASSPPISDQDYLEKLRNST